MNKRFDFISRKIYQDANHVFDLVPPDHILSKIFQPYRYITKLAGILPLKFSKDGQVSYKLVSWASAYTAMAYSTFIFDSSLLIPMYLFLVKVSSSGTAGSQKLTHVAQLMFISCQYLGAALTYVLSSWNTPMFVKYWNTTQQLVEKIAVLNSTSNRNFLSVYLGARWNIRIWMVASVSFSLHCVYSYGSGFDLYMGNDSHPFLYWMMYTGLCLFPYMLCFHILHSILFVTLCSVLRTCFRTLKTHCESLSHDKFGDTTKLYREINELITEIGRVEGIYVAIEVIIMIICVTMNAFFLVSKFNGVGESLIYVAIIVSYCAWFHWLCQLGESLTNEGKQCCMAVKRLASKDSGNSEWALIEPPVEVSARGYFSIRMSLFTKVMGTIATYLIVLLQFKFSSPLENVKGSSAFSPTTELVGNMSSE